jgi:hypothetical protein
MIAGLPLYWWARSRAVKGAEDRYSPA